MRVLTSEEAVEKLSRRRCKRSQSAMETFSDDSGPEDGQVASYASSVTLRAESGGTDSSANDERRSTDIEHQLASQQEMIHKLLSSSEAVSPPASNPEEIYEPPPAHTPEENRDACTSRTSEDAYESARTEAGFSNQHAWNAAYVHGMVRIEGKPSQAITKSQPCSACADASRFAVCVSLMDDDPFKEFLVDKKNLCCGWCEYQKMQTVKEQQPEQRIQAKAQSSTSFSNEETGQVYSEPTEMHGSKEPKLSTKQTEFFISGEGLDREVITSEIPRYLGVDSLVRPGLCRDPVTHKFIQGFYIKAHRPPTSAMLADIRAESATWRLSKEGRKLGHTAANLKEAYPGKQPSRYQTYHFDFEYRRN